MPDHDNSPHCHLLQTTTACYNLLQTATNCYKHAQRTFWLQAVNNCLKHFITTSCNHQIFLPACIKLKDGKFGWYFPIKIFSAVLTLQLSLACALHTTQTGTHHAAPPVTLRTPPSRRAWSLPTARQSTAEGAAVQHAHHALHAASQISLTHCHAAALLHLC